MDFELTDDQQLIQQTVREFAEKELAPNSLEWDRQHKLPFDELIPKLGELGLLSQPYPEDVGGAGVNYLSYILSVEEVAKVDPSVAVVTSVNNSLALGPIWENGTEEQKAEWMPKIATTAVGCFALTEPGAGTDAAMQKTTAILDGDNYVMNGSKQFISNGGISDLTVVFAKTDPDPSLGTKGISALIVENASEGFSAGDAERKMGIRAANTPPLFFSNVKVPKENLLGKEGRGFNIAMQTLDGGRIGIAAQAVGIAQGAFDIAVQYSKERVQFGKPISAFQVIQFKLADMMAKIEAARLLTYKAAQLKQDGKPFAVAAATAKLVASRAAVEVTDEAMQILGGIGYTEAYAVERLYRDAKITEIYEGTSEVQRMVISRAALS